MRVARGKMRAGGGEQRLEPERPARGVRAVGAEHRFQPGQARTQLRHFGEAGGIGDQRLHARVAQPVVQRVDAEQRRKRQGHRAKLVNGDVAGRDIRALRQQDRDALARLDA